MSSAASSRSSSRNSYASHSSRSHASSRGNSPAAPVSAPAAAAVAQRAAEVGVPLLSARASSSPAITTSAANTPRGPIVKARASPSPSGRASAKASPSSSPRSSRSASPSLSRGSSRPPTGSARNAVKAVSASRKTSAANLRVAAAADQSPTDSTAKVPLTAEETAQWKALEQDNKRLVLQLADLNTALDKQLSRQGISVPSRPGGAAAAAGLGKDALAPSSEAARLKSRIDALRKANGEMHKALKEHSAVRGSSFDLKNKHTQLVKELEGLRSDNQSLENVYNNQSSKTSQEDKIERELAKMRAEHTEVQRESRDTARQLKELRETEMTNLRYLLKQQDLINEKLRFLAEEQATATAAVNAGGTNALPSPAEVGVSDDAPNASASPQPTPSSPERNEYGLLVPTSGRYALPPSTKKPYDVATLQLILQSLTTEEADTMADINALVGRSHKARWRKVVDRRTQELEDLKDELRLLREHADAKRIAY